LTSIELSFYLCNILRDSRKTSPGETKMWAVVRENGHFYRAIRRHSTDYTVTRCLSVLLSKTFSFMSAP